MFRQNRCNFGFMQNAASKSVIGGGSLHHKVGFYQRLNLLTLNAPAMVG